MQAHHYAPSIIFIDEIDCICSNRCEGMCDSDRMLVRSELLKQMDGMHKYDQRMHLMVYDIVAS